MDERQTLSILGWTIGAIIGIAFVLNGAALAMC
jgi:hypothetical protein